MARVNFLEWREVYILVWTLFGIVALARRKA